MKLLTALLLSSISLVANADLVVNESVKNTNIQTRQEYRTNFDDLLEEAVIKTEEESVNKDEEEQQQETYEKNEAEVLEKVEVVVLENETLYSSKNIYSLKLTPSKLAKVYSLTISKDNKKISESHYFARNATLLHEIKLIDGQGKYTITYSEYDDSTIFRKKILTKDYILIFTNPDIINNAKTSRWVQAKDPKITSLASEIVSGARSEREKVISVNRWIVQNIAYNYSTDAFNQKIDALTTLNLRTAICTGYANIFAALARASGLEVHVMTGKAKNGLGQTYYHQWNEVKIDGTWYFIDPTWNSGSKLGELTYFAEKSQYPKSHTRRKIVYAY